MNKVKENRLKTPKKGPDFRDKRRHFTRFFQGKRTEKRDFKGSKGPNNNWFFLVRKERIISFVEHKEHLNFNRHCIVITEAGVVVLTRSQKWSKLKAWGLKLMRKKGIKKVSLAVGRKLAVIMHRMLPEQKEFVWGEAPAKVA